MPKKVLQFSSALESYILPQKYDKENEIILKNNKQISKDGMGHVGLNEERSLGWRVHVTIFCLSSISNGGSPEKYYLLLWWRDWISGRGKDKAAIPRISEENVELPYVIKFIITGYSLEKTTTSEKNQTDWRILATNTSYVCS